MDANASQEHVVAADAAAPPVADPRPAAVLRGTARGLEIHLLGTATVHAIAAAVNNRLDDAPGFFRGSDVRIKVEDGPLPAGCLTRLEDIATRFELRIVEVTAVKRARASDEDAVPQPNLAAGSAPAPAQLPAQVQAQVPSDDQAFDDAPTLTAAAALAAPVAAAPVASAPVAAAPVASAPVAVAPVASAPVIAVAPVASAPVVAPAPVAVVDAPIQTPAPLAVPHELAHELEALGTGTKLVIGPVRSGVILEHAGHLIVFGDVNPGAEIRAEGNIVVLGRLRGTAHAGIGQDVGFILALRLEPQQLRIGRKVARAADSDTPASDAEIAYCTGDTIVVERYTGKLPRNLASSI